MTVTALKIEPGISSWEEVDLELKSIAQTFRNLVQRRSHYQAKIERLKDSMKKEIDDFNRKMDRSAREIYLYTLTRMDELDGRSKKLLHGTVAFRRSVTLKIPRDQKMVIESLKKLGKYSCIETVDKIKKIELKKQDAAIIEAVGGKLVEKDNFRLELRDHIFEYDKKLKVVSTDGKT